MKKIIYLFFALVALSACDLDEQPVTATGVDAIFNNENGLQLYCNQFYSDAPDRVHNVGSYGLTCFTGTQNFFTPNYTADNGGSFNLNTVRACNYFLEHNNYSSVPDDVKANYNGIARMVRANSYASFIETYNDVPWVDHVLDVKETDILYGTQTPRAEVADHVYDDYVYAYDNIKADYDNTASTFTKAVAAMNMARFCLKEASWRKYHDELGLTSTADLWYQRTIEACEKVMNSGKYSLYKGSGASSYRDMFFQTSLSKISSEVIFGQEYGSAINKFHSTTRGLNDPTFMGGCISPTRYFMNMFLMKDGSRYTDKPGYENETYWEETKDRDPRMEMNYRLPGLIRNSATGVPTPSPVDWKTCKSGYQNRKFCSDDIIYDSSSTEYTAQIVMRYAEILLMWAEAKAELGSMTDDDWKKSVGAIRERAGITGGLDTKPTVADPYLMTIFYGVTDPVILEVRRERWIEMDHEIGAQWTDIRRWKEGKILELPQIGIYIPEFDKFYDMDGDGVEDVYFYTSEDKKPADLRNEVRYIFVDVAKTGKNSEFGVCDDGHRLLYNISYPNRTWMDRCYLSPIGTTQITLNPNLHQNPGW